jgi:hypothetical protein
MNEEGVEIKTELFRSSLGLKSKEICNSSTFLKGSSKITK